MKSINEENKLLHFEVFEPVNENGYWTQRLEISVKDKSMTEGFCERGERLSWNNNCHEKPNQREEQSGWRDYSRDSSFGIPCEVDACLAAAIGKTTDITAKANTWSAALACWRTNASPINPSTSSLLFIITGYSVFQKAIIGANSFSNLRTYETIW